MKFLITGGCGFIGSNYIRYLLNRYRDVRVVNVDELSYGSSLANLKDYESDKRYEFIRGSIADGKLIERLVSNVDVVVNFAAQTHVDRSIADPWPFVRSNVEGVVTILEAIRHHARDVRLVHVGSDEVYGDILQGCFTEEDRLRPSSPYAATKAAADLLCLAYHRTYGLDAIITRCTNNFGPYQFPEKLIPKTIIRAHLNMKVPIYGTGKNVRDWIYVLDHCEALDLVAQKGRAGQIYNISSGKELTNLEVVKRILEIMGKPEDFIELVEDRPGHDIRYSLDSSKIRNELGWRPRYEFEEALAKTIEWYLKNKWWWSSLADERVLHPKPWALQW